MLLSTEISAIERRATMRGGVHASIKRPRSIRIALARALIRKATSPMGTSGAGPPARTPDILVDQPCRSTTTRRESSTRMAGLPWPDIPPAVRDPSAPPGPSVYQRSCPVPVVIRGDPYQRLEPRHDQDSVSADHDDTPTSPTSSVAPSPTPCGHAPLECGVRAVSVSSKDSADTS
jgi:hypothetical protein